jgi:hypothetical protein
MRLCVLLAACAWLSGCAAQCGPNQKAVEQACPALPVIGDTETLADYSQRVVQMYGVCASLHTSTARTDAGS